MRHVGDSFSVAGDYVFKLMFSNPLPMLPSILLYHLWESIYCMRVTHMDLRVCLKQTRSGQVAPNNFKSININSIQINRIIKK